MHNLVGIDSPCNYQHLNNHWLIWAFFFELGMDQVIRGEHCLKRQYDVLFQYSGQHFVVIGRWTSSQWYRYNFWLLLFYTTLHVLPCLIRINANKVPENCTGRCIGWLYTVTSYKAVRGGSSWCGCTHVPFCSHISNMNTSTAMHMRVHPLMLLLSHPHHMWLHR